MGNRNFKEDILSMLEFEIGFRGKFILKQQCEHMGIKPDDIGHQNIVELVGNIGKVMAGTMGAKRADAAHRWLLEYAKAIETIYKGTGVTIRKAKALIVLGDKRFQIRKFDGSVKAYRLARRASVGTKRIDPFLECRIRRKLARALSQSRSDFAEAKAEYENAIALGNQIKDYYDVSLCYLGLGTVAGLEKEFEAAMEYFRKAFESMELIPPGPGEGKEKRLKAESQINMALADLHMELRDTDKSITYNERAIDIFMETENYLGVEKLFRKMRTIYRHKKECEKLSHDPKSVNFNSGNNGQLLMEGWTRMNLASLLMESGNYTQAEEHLSKAYEIISEFDYPEAHSKLHCIYGDFYYRTNDFDDCESHYLQSLNSQNSPECYARAQEGLGTLYMHKGEKEKGYALLKSALAWYQSNQNHSEANRISGILASIDSPCPLGIAIL